MPLETPTSGEQATKPQRSARKMFATATLSLQALVLFFATLVAHGLADLPRGIVWGVGCGLALACILIVGTLRFEWGYWLGWVVQVPVLICAIWLPAVGIIGVVFLAIWWWGEQAGKKIDRERAQFQHHQA
ncbi:MAG TPA: DUF4233 domain-containing protein [Beutenbergiaceae bacterium]|nr:DUF4233 domain-containing protein [Beutenbergiaceae bacterium]